MENEKPVEENKAEEIQTDENPPEEKQSLIKTVMSVSPGPAVKIVKIILGFYGVVYIALGVFAFIFAASFSEAKPEELEVLAFYPIPVGVLYLFMGGTFIHVMMDLGREKILFIVVLVAKWLGIIIGIVTLFRIKFGLHIEILIIVSYIVDIILSLALLLFAVKGSIFTGPSSETAE